MFQVIRLGHCHRSRSRTFLGDFLEIYERYIRILRRHNSDVIKTAKDVWSLES